MKKSLVVWIFLCLLAYAPPEAHAQKVRQYCANADGTDVTVTTTGETVTATTTCQTPGTSQIRADLHCSGIITTSANSTTYKMRIRRTSVSGTALGDAVAETIKVAAAGTEAFFLDATDQQNVDQSSVTYVCTIEFAGADATGTAKWNYLRVVLY